jgi:hypothetical protein
MLSSDILREVEGILNARDIALGTLVVNVLRDATTSLGTSMISNLVSTLEALRPRLGVNEKAGVLLGWFLLPLHHPSSCGYLVVFLRRRIKPSWWVVLGNEGK